MMTSVDGRIDCAMTEQLPGVEEYYETLEALEAPTRVSGRVTAQLEMALPGVFESKSSEARQDRLSQGARRRGLRGDRRHARNAALGEGRPPPARCWC